MDPDEQPDEGVQKVPSTAASVPVELGLTTLRAWMRSPSWKLSQLHISGIFMEASPHRHDT